MIKRESIILIRSNAVRADKTFSIPFLKKEDIKKKFFWKKQNKNFLILKRPHSTIAEKLRNQFSTLSPCHFHPFLPYSQVKHKFMFEKLESFFFLYIFVILYQSSFNSFLSLLVWFSISFDSADNGCRNISSMLVLRRNLTTFSLTEKLVLFYFGFIMLWCSMFWGGTGF